jgi:fibrillarin-like rRNA methylase
MKASSYFTDGEIELAMGILADLLSNQDFLNEISISHDATDKYYKLVDKIDVYFNDLDFRNETPQE